MTPAKKQSKIDGYDLLILLGLAGLGTGIWWIAPPAALITVGALLMALGIFGASTKGAAR